MARRLATDRNQTSRLRPTVDKPDLEALCKELQAELRLQDWRIDVSYVADLQSGGRPVHGLCSNLVDAKVARIQIRDPETPATSADPSVEETLIHELLHLHMAPLSGSSRAEIAAEEQAVWAITEALSTAKDAARRGLIARAMVAHSAARTRRSQPVTRRQTTMDPATIAALRALLNTDDVGAALKTFLDSMEGAASGDSGGGEAPPPAAQEPPPAPPADEDPNKPKAQRAVPAPTPRPAAAAPTAPRAQAIRPVQVVAPSVTPAELDKFKVDVLLDTVGKELTPGQRAFASTLSYEQARAFLAIEEPDQSASRRSSATVGAKKTGATGAAPALDRELAEIDRRMGVSREVPQPVRIDPVTRRLEISALAPVQLQALNGAGKGE